MSAYTEPPVEKDAHSDPDALQGDSPREKDAPEVDNDKIAKDFKPRLESAKRNRRQFYTEWKRNVELRIGHIASIFTGGVDVEDDIQTEINPDWSLTKTKTANLYSQVPTVQITHENKQYAAAMPPFNKALNYELSEKRTNVGVSMEEVLNDVVNAAGIGAIHVGYAARFVDKEVPVKDAYKNLPDEVLQQAKAAGLVEMQTVPQVVSYKFFTSRISPVDMLWPSDFTGSNFDDGDFIGHTGRMPWAEAKSEFKLKDEDKDKVNPGYEVATQDDLRSEPDKGDLLDQKGVKYDELYYWRYRVDPEEKSFSAIWRLVYVNGITKPVIHEPWKGQQFDPQTYKHVGASKFPIRVLTLTYITDNPVPPSDSAAGRPQVNDMRRSRSQMFQNRERSIPIRWFDPNRVGIEVQDTLMKGTWQGMIPTNGDGSRSIGEIARASYPAEDMSFDAVAKQDLMETWQIGPAQMGLPSPGGKKANAQQQAETQNFATRIGQERNRCAQFFLSICEVLAGWMVLYSDFPSLSDQEKQAMQGAWDDKKILGDLVMKIRPDSAVVLDAGQRLQRLTQFLNLTAKSGFVNIQPIIVEMAELSGLDPSEIIIQPQPKPPEEPNMSYRFTGKDDLQDPVVMAMLIKHKKAPSPEELEGAKKLLTQAAMPPADESEAPQGAPGPAGAPGPHPPGPGGAGGPIPHPMDIKHNSDHTLPDKIVKRSRDANG